MEDFGIAVVMVLFAVALYSLGWLSALPIESSEPIIPELRIEIKKGVADTTYIYDNL